MTLSIFTLYYDFLILSIIQVVDLIILYEIFLNKMDNKKKKVSFFILSSKDLKNTY